MSAPTPTTGRNGYLREFWTGLGLAASLALTSVLML